MKKTTTYRRMMTVILCTAVALIILPSAASAGNDNPGVLPPNSRPLGATYGEWGGRWWQWVAAQPTDVNPLLDSTGENCAQGQSGPVWFLAGTSFTLPLGVERTCTIPTGKHLFFPVVNVGWWTLNSDVEFCLANFDSVEECARQSIKDYMDYLMANAEELSVTIDGKDVDLHITEQVLSPYRVVSPSSFVFRLPLDNAYDVPADQCRPVDGELDCSPGYSDGVFLMLAPLSSGEHTIRIVASPNLDVTYNLTVQGGKSAKGGTTITVVGADGPHEISLDNSLFLPFVGAVPVE